MNVLSLFDGISCGQVALERAGIKINKYFASEVKSHAIKLTQKRYPDTIQLGDVRHIRFKDGILYSDNGTFGIGKIDLLIGGSPCQDFSILTSMYEHKNILGEKSNLFFEYHRLLHEIHPEYFLLENMVMNKDMTRLVNMYMNTTPIKINSALVSYQRRIRLYWTNINGGHIAQPKDKRISWQDYIDRSQSELDHLKVNKTPFREKGWNDGNFKKANMYRIVNIADSEKIPSLTTYFTTAPCNGIPYQDFFRTLSRPEMELAQTLPVGYTEGLTLYQTQDVIGDGWTVDVIAHIFSYLTKKQAKRPSKFCAELREKNLEAIPAETLILDVVCGRGTSLAERFRNDSSIKEPLAILAKYHGIDIDIRNVANTKRLLLDAFRERFGARDEILAEKIINKNIVPGEIVTAPEKIDITLETVTDDKIIFNTYKYTDLLKGTGEEITIDMLDWTYYANGKYHLPSPTEREELKR